jgi:ribosomal protein L23
MRITPILTEKSLALAKKGFYSFWLNQALTKNEIKAWVSRFYAVHVTAVRTMRYKAGEKTNQRGRKVRIPGRKKAVVTLKPDEKIAAFEVKKEKKKK